MLYSYFTHALLMLYSYMAFSETGTEITCFTSTKVHILTGDDAFSETGIDWDNCYFWESEGSKTFVDRGKPPAS